MPERQSNLTGHLTELRNRIVIVLVGFVLAFVAGLFLAKPIILYLQNAEEAEGIAMNAFRLTDPLNVYMQFAFIIGIVLLSPLLLYQVWAFIAPGLYERERRVTLSYIPLAVILFLGGIAFSYYILFPNIVGFMGNLSNLLNIQSEIGINEYFSFMLQMTLPFGFLFQMPILVMFLTRLGLVTPMLLTRIRKYAYFGLIVLAGIITPPEIVSHLMVSVPLILLYEVSILISRAAYKNSNKPEDHGE